MKTGRWFVALGAGELVIVATYVLDRFTDADLSSASALLKVLLVVGAALIAGSSYHSWSATPTSVSLLATLFGLLGGAALASTVVTAHASEVYASATMATIGTVGLVVSVAFAQIGLARAQGGTAVIELLTPTQLDEMRPAGEFVASVLTALSEAADIGVNLLDLDALAHEMIRERGAESCYIDYHPSFGAMPFGKVLCTSVNDAVLHGLPHDYKLRDSDLVSFDFAVSVDGWVCDSALSVVVGTPRAEDLELIATAQEALDAAIGVARAGNKVGDISAAIGEVGRSRGLSVNTQFGGHGVGRTMHGDPHIPNDGRPGRGFPLQPGLVIAIEPWFLQTTDEIVMDPDGWTIRSADGSRGAHVEHTIAITDGDPIIMTARS